MIWELIGILLLLLVCPLQAADRPNIVFMMADDLGYTDVSCYGSKYYETSNVDRLAARELKLLNHHQCQNCAPKRAALMSGQYGARSGVYTVGSINRFDWRSQPLRPADNVTELPMDRGETKNLAESNPKEATELHDRLIAWRGEVNAPMPTPNDRRETKVTKGKLRKRSTE